MTRPVRAAGRIVAAGLAFLAVMAAAEPLRVLHVPDYPPYEYLDAQGRPQGIFIELYRRWSEVTGRPIEFHAMSFVAEMQALREGRGDVITGLNYTPERSREFDFARAILPEENHFVARLDAPLPQRLDQIRGMVVGVVAGEVAVDLVRRAGADARIFDSYARAVRAAVAGEVPVLLTCTHVVRYHLIREDALGQFRFADQPVISLDFRPGVVRNSALIAELDAGFALIADADKEAIVQRWLPAHSLSESRRSWQRLAFISGGTLALVALVSGGLFLINRGLRRRIGAATAHLIESEARIRSILDACPYGIAILDHPDGRILEVNANWERDTGFTQARALGATMRELGLIGDGDAHRTFARRLRERGELDLELDMTKAGGAVFMAQLSIRLATTRGRACVIAYQRDVTEQRSLEAQRRQMEKLAALGQLAGGVAHDFNNVLGGILGYADLLAARVGDDRGRYLASRLNDAIERARTSTRQLLRFARKGGDQPERFDAHDAIRAAVCLFTAAASRTIVVELDLAAASSQVEGWPTQLQNAVLNLCLNARDAADGRGAIRIATHVVELDPITASSLRPAPPPAREAIAISVADEGVGMTGDVMARCFDAFFTTKGEGGTGLGLASVQTTVAEHRGGVRVASTPGKGSTFTVYLPLAARSSPALEAHAAPPPPRVAGDVLVVDDEPLVRRSLVELLAALGHRVIELDDGEDAVAWCAIPDHAVALVLIDLKMRRMGGAAAFRAIRRLRPGLPVILASGDTDDPTVADMRRDGLDGVLIKPVRLADLVAALDVAGARCADLTVRPASP